MLASKEESPIYNVKISSVGPGHVSGQNAIQELTGMDLTMKLHYIRTIYYFESQAFEGFTITPIKASMFSWLNHAFVPCGRLRRADSGRPYIKCNDCGARLIEAQCRMSLDEWLESKDESRHKLLFPDQMIGPELAFSPLVLLQITRFKCGGASVGMSWAHVLGEAFSATGYINLWGKAISGQFPAQPLKMAQPQLQNYDPQPPKEEPLSIKRVGPLGDHWVTSNTCKMGTFSFHISMDELTRLQSKICGEKNNQQIPPFESICTVVWQCVAKVKQGDEPKVVTVCKNDPKNTTTGVISNKSQVISVVKTDFSIMESSPMELGLLIMNQAVDERRKLEEAMDKESELPDFLVYGANLTFVDWGDVPFYDLDVKGSKPVYVACGIDNIGDEGVVLVLPAPKDAGKDRSGGRIVSITLPENQVSELKSLLEKEWSIV